MATISGVFMDATFPVLPCDPDSPAETERILVFQFPEDLSPRRSCRRTSRQDVDQPQGVRRAAVSRGSDPRPSVTSESRPLTLSQAPDKLVHNRRPNGDRLTHLDQPMPVAAQRRQSAIFDPAAGGTKGI